MCAWRAGFARPPRTQNSSHRRDITPNFGQTTPTSSSRPSYTSAADGAAPRRGTHVRAPRRKGIFGGSQADFAPPTHIKPFAPERCHPGFRTNNSDECSRSSYTSAAGGAALRQNTHVRAPCQRIGRRGSPAARNRSPGKNQADDERRTPVTSGPRRGPHLGPRPGPRKRSVGTSSSRPRARRLPLSNRRAELFRIL